MCWSPRVGLVNLGVCLTQLCRGLLQNAAGQEANTTQHKRPTEGPAEGNPRCPATADQGPTATGTTRETTCKHVNDNCMHAEEIIMG